MTAFNNIKPNTMPQSDADKDTDVLIGEIQAGVPGNFTAVQAKISELIGRIVKNGDSDDIVVSGTAVDRGGIRPKHTPLI